MAGTIRQIEYFYVQVPNKPGEGARALRVLQDAGVNLLAFSGFPSGGRAQICSARRGPAEPETSPERLRPPMREPSAAVVGRIR